MLNQNYPFDFVLRKSNPFILKNTSYTETPKHWYSIYQNDFN